MHVSDQMKQYLAELERARQQEMILRKLREQK
jgi:hypothetical protein